MRDGREVVYVERGDASAKWFLWGAIAGAAVAVLYAPATGEQTRRGLQRRLRKLRAMAEEKIDELTDELGSRREDAEEWLEDAEDEVLDEFEEDEEEVEEEVIAVNPRADLERRLEQARARRRGTRAAEESEG
jgi:gas vesicle protein